MAERCCLDDDIVERGGFGGAGDDRAVGRVGGELAEETEGASSGSLRETDYRMEADES